MGRALILNTNFEKRGFRLIGAFDIDPEKIGKAVGKYEIQDYKEIKAFIEKEKPQMAIVAVSKKSVNMVANELEEMGIRGFLNFSYAELNAKEGAAVENIHLSDSLMRLSYKMRNDGKTEF